MVNVFSFCLYGPDNPFYYKGLLENIWLAGKYFPTWKVYVYLGSDVTKEMRDYLAVLSSVVIFDTGITGYKNMVHRFFAIDNPEVELMLVRDADSRIHWKDRWAIREFLKNPQYIGHVIRDNREHKVPLLGGLWGMRKIPNLSIRKLYESHEEEVQQRQKTGYDQDFLALCVYPVLSSSILIHYSNNCLLKGEQGVEFPFAWNNETFCGRGETGIFLDVPDPEHIPIKKPTMINLPQVSIRIK